MMRSNQNQLIRARALVIHENTVLLMKRIKAGYEYYTLPGGKVEANETPEDACVREVFEETTVDVKIDREFARDNDVFENIANTHIVFLCDYIKGVPTLSGEEKERSTPENYYEPLWVKKTDFGKLVILPELLVPLISKAFNL